ncbi:MAG: Bicyclomycin resistance protein [Chlamydiia bacterium]|nr:Bicyclomycin resistance protein [Chlamydiia bacterium]MCH9615572.1 Bicyclomycin resistance protein [Chlamydiia bacterium]MCH9629227.1 Bicyclomycin resistance protein [Chlamydiia bacterium]
MLIRQIFLLTPLVVAFAIALDMYIPVVPEMVHILNTKPSTVQWTLSIFMLVCGLGQPLIGPISDEFGRRKTILGSITIFVLGSIFCSLAPNITLLILARALQGLGSCGMTVGAFAVVRDTSHGTSSAKMFSYLEAAIGASPLLAPTVGGYLSYAFGWRAPFYFLTIFGILTFLLMAFRLKETHPPEHRLKFDRALFTRYKTLLTDREFIGYAFATAASMACFFTFFSVSPYLLIDLLGVPMQHFGRYFGFIGLVYVISCFIAARFVGRLGIFRTALYGIFLLSFSGIVMLAWYYLWGLSTMGLTLPLIFFGIGCAMAMGAGASGALEHFASYAGAASAMLGASQFVLSFLVGTFVMTFTIRSTLPLAWTLILLGALAVILLLRISKQPHTR